MRIYFIIYTTIVSLLLAGCATQNIPTKVVAQHSDKVIMDSYNSRGQLVTSSYQKNPQRIVAIWQNSVETLIALGAGEQIVAAVGIPDPNYLRPEHRALYDKIPYKTNLHPDTENILMLQPDLIVAWQSSFGEKLLRSSDFWHSRGVDTYISNLPKSNDSMLEKEYSYIMDMGKICDRTHVAGTIVHSMRQRIESIAEQKKRRNITTRPRVLVAELYGREIAVYGRHSLAGELVEKLDGQLALDSKRTSIEQIRAIDPDVIFLVTIESQHGREQSILDSLKSHPVLKNLHSIQSDRIYTVPLYTVYCSGVRLADSIEIFSRGMYPELYED